MLMFDSLNRHFLPPYGCDWVHAPNFSRLAAKTVTFDHGYAGSLPCMPARRELHTGRYNFLHRSWGPIEPYDDSMPEILRKNGIYSHLVSDHFHYWEDGGATYHERYSSWNIVRGQQIDPWKPVVQDPEIPESLNFYGRPEARYELINRKYLKADTDYPQAQTFRLGMEFLDANCHADNWFLQVETFDPHEPFLSPQRFKDYYSHEYNGPGFDCPRYQPVTETPEQVEHCRMEYASLVSMCDEYLGKFLDKMDELDLWKDTLLIVNTDHGFLLGEHGVWGKTIHPCYEEIAHIPLFIWDPWSGKKGERNSCLVQTIDLAPTILDYFGLPVPKDMRGKSLKETIRSEKTVREAALFGVYGGHVNCTDGRYVYMRAPVNDTLYEYTLMPTHMRGFFTDDELSDLQMQRPFSFTKGYRTLKAKAVPFQGVNARKYGSLLYDLQMDPGEISPIKDKMIEKRMTDYIIYLMKEDDAPSEQMERLGLLAERQNLHEAQRC